MKTLNKLMLSFLLTFATLQAGVTKYRVYWWVEGQDVEAENNATGTAMRLNLEFAIKE